MMEKFSGSGGSISTGATKKTGSENTGMMKNIAKLAVIATGVASIVGFVQKIASMTIQASPILQSMLKLLNTGIMFMLRPIGDFIGFFLRPIIVYFIRNIALPMYKTWSPIMRQLGSFLGSGFVGLFGQNLTSNLTFEPLPNDPLFGTDGFFTKLPQRFEGWDIKLQSVRIPDFGKMIHDTIMPFVVNLGSLLTVLLSGFISTSNNALLPAMNGIGEFFMTALNGFTRILGTTVLPVISGIGGFFQGILDRLIKDVSGTWDAIVNFFRELAERLSGLPNLIWESFTNLLGIGGNTGSTTNNENNISIDIFGSAVESVETAKESLASFFNDLVSGK